MAFLMTARAGVSADTDRPCGRGNPKSPAGKLPVRPLGVVADTARLVGLFFRDPAGIRCGPWDRPCELSREQSRKETLKHSKSAVLAFDKMRSTSCEPQPPRETLTGVQWR
jgi:hypothetical protein